mmetsp:Transcript_13539/g.17179  ORF Transcript_13539/g.17179 Transcript_13539/m.17179 type:complete len:81 (+) Transcript_13539:366-608(+)
MNIPVIDWYDEFLDSKNAIRQPISPAFYLIEFVRRCLCTVWSCVEQPREEVGGEEMHPSIPDQGSNDVHGKAVNHVALQP